MELPFRKKVIIGFIVFYVFFLFLNNFPFHPITRRKLQDSLLTYNRIHGLHQDWTMFSNPPRENRELRAEIYAGERLLAVIGFPRMERMGYFERYQKERFRKWAYEHVLFGTQIRILPEAARWMARRYYFESGKKGPQPTHVHLVKCLVPIPPPPKTLGAKESQRSPATQCELHYKYLASWMDYR